MSRSTGARTPKSRAQWERGVPVMPGGVIKGAYWSPPYPHYIARAKGCHIWDIDGNRYVDFGNHHSAMMLGHSHPDVVAAVQREVERGFGLGGPTELEAEIAEEITVPLSVHRQGPVLQLGHGGVPPRDAAGQGQDGQAEGRQVRGGLPRQPRCAGGKLGAAT